MSGLRWGIRRATVRPMVAAHRFLAFLLFAAPAILMADQSFLRAAAETNVNQRYTIESISIAGVQIEQAKLPSTLRSRLAEMIGERCDFVRLQDLATELRRELHLREVSQHLLRGSQPDRIRVNFEFVQKPVSFDVSVPRFVYNSALGGSGELHATVRTGANRLTLGILSNGEDLVERFNGASLRYENVKLGTDRVRLRLDVEKYETERVDYRKRRNVAPQVAFSITGPLTVSAGLSFEQMELNRGGSVSANALTGQIRYNHKTEGGTVRQSADGNYSVRAGSRGLGSDYGYSRHSVSVRYEVKAGRQIASDEFSAGAIVGQAPSFERFVLGNRFAFDPQGGNRMVHNAVSYGYQMGEGTGEVFYDSGTLSRAGQSTSVRHSAGIGYRQGVFVIAMAFPLYEGRVTPVFMAGVNY